MSADSQDYQMLSPGHFLIGRLLTVPASSNLTDIPVERLDRYKKVEKVRQHFWLRWSTEYSAIVDYHRCNTFL
ncbi:unnamed protein product, partial [Iphiclides podalirius]